MTTTTQEFIKKLRAFSIPLTGVPNFVEAEYLMKESADALEALQAELDEWRFTNKIDELQRVNEGLQAEVANLRRKQRVTEGLAGAYEAERDAALARLAEIENQEPAYLLTPDGKCYAYGSAQPLSAGHADATLLKLYAAAGASLVATPIVAWAKSTPRKLRITTMDMGREDGWRPLGYTAAGASPVEPSQAPLTDAEIEKLREKTFSTNNPFCPVDSKSMRKAVRAAEAAHGIKQGGQQ